MKILLVQLLCGLILLVETAHCILTYKPRDVSAIVGSTVVLACFTNLSVPVLWLYEENYETFLRELTQALHADEEKKSRYHISENPSTGQYNITINNVQLKDAGTYFCIDNEGNDNIFYEHAFATAHLRVTVSAPPRIIKQAPVEKAYKYLEPVTLPCLAEGVPHPSYTWKRNGQPLHMMGLEIRQMPGEGTIIIESPVSVHEGVYQCFAENEHGVALSVKTLLKLAVLEPFPKVKEPKTHRVAVGQPLVLTCQPPISYPTASVYWGENWNESKLKPIQNNDRISLDYHGNLYFSNIVEEDDLKRMWYVCIVNNNELRSLVQGDDQKILTTTYTERPKYESPKLMWSSPSSDIAIKGQTKKMKCIFSGFPTPTVTWVRLDAAMPSKNEITSFGQELTIHDVKFSDRGRYQCKANNTESGIPVTREFFLTVESPPYWRNDKPPVDVNCSEEEDAMFECQVNGVPKPVVDWYINGIPLANARPNKRRVLSQHNTLTFRSVTKTDAQVIQCNASNTHGYIFANAFLNVLG